jgi:hypothetical protein
MHILHRQLETVPTTDVLTGLYNRYEARDVVFARAVARNSAHLLAL